MTPWFSDCKSEVLVDIGGIINLNIEMAETKFLLFPWDIMKDKEEIESLILGLHIQISN